MTRISLAFLLLVGATGAHAQTAPAGQEGRTAFLARCRTAMVRANPDSTGWAAGECAEKWKRVLASAPYVDAIAIIAAKPAAELRTPAQVQAALPKVKWNPRAKAAAPYTVFAEGQLGSMGVNAGGKNVIESFSLNWSEKGELPPYDVAEAFRVRGAKVQAIACAHGVGAFGDGDSFVYRVELAGVAPFALSTFSRTAALAMQDSFYTVDMALGKPLPTLASLRRSSEAGETEGEWTADCG